MMRSGDRVPYKTCRAAISDECLFTDTGINEQGENERQTNDAMIDQRERLRV